MLRGLPRYALSIPLSNTRLQGSSLSYGTIFIILLASYYGTVSTLWYFRHLSYFKHVVCKGMQRPVHRVCS